MSRHRELKIRKDDYYICPYCESKVEWFGYDNEGGEYQCSKCHEVWGIDGKVIKDK